MIKYPYCREVVLGFYLVVAMAFFAVGEEAGLDAPQHWVDGLLRVPYAQAESEPASTPVLQLLRQDYEELEIGRSVIKTPPVIGQQRFRRGLGTHSVGHIQVRSPEPLSRFSAWIGVDHNERTSGGRGSVVFVVAAGGRELYRSGIMRGGEEPAQVDVDLGRAKVVDLLIEDAGDGPACDHADWAEAKIVCASGKILWLDELPRRIDLETVMRMHVHQKSDYWFDNEVDQASIWGLSQYLPNHVFMAPVNRMDDYSFHSAMATSLCLGWIADAEDFDFEHARQLVDRYRRVRPLLVGAWYPLLPYTRDKGEWMASQYHRPDLGEGIVLAFRHAESPEETRRLSLHGLDRQATYELDCLVAKRKLVAGAAELTAGFPVTIAEKPGSEVIVYREVRD